MLATSICRIVTIQNGFEYGSQSCPSFVSEELVPPCTREFSRILRSSPLHSSTQAPERPGQTRCGFWKKLGFQERMRAWESHLDLASFDARPFQGHLDRVKAEGIALTTLAEEKKRDPDWLGKI